ncbi:hypothetical protein [Solibacillus sp. FSL K6-1523]|uniref:hypothetical protein n=1 Tax=Solibacillus sp. FSL K6-1523 TaxID=2921471 RepID=UPI0030FC7E52
MKPEVYELNKKWTVIYEFGTQEDREKGEKEFATKTANFNLVSYTSFIKRNLLIFYVYEEDLNSNQIPFYTEKQAVLDSLFEG